MMKRLTQAGRPQRQSRETTTRPPQVPAHPQVERVASGQVVLAAVVGAHGIGGEVRLKLFTADLSPYRSFNNGALTLTTLRPNTAGAIARFAEVPDRSAAEALRGTVLAVSRSELPPLPEGEYYYADLIGIVAVSTDGEALGRVVAVENFGAGEILEIERPTGKRFMVPITACEIGEQALVDAAYVD